MSRPPTPIGLLTTELGVGGAERCLVNLALRLDRQRFLPAVYALDRRPASGHDQLVRSLEEAGIPVRFVGVRRPWQLPMAVGRLRRLLADQRPALLQCFLFHAHVVGTCAALGAGVPVVVHGIRVADPSRWRAVVERQASRRAQRIVCVSQAVADFARRAGMPADKLLVIPNGIDASRYPAEQPADLVELGVPTGRRVILYVGRLDEQKGTDWLVELAPRLLESLDDVHLVLAGNGPQRAQLRRRLDELQLAGRVHLVGWRADVGQLMRASSLLVLPSRWEGMPNVLLEAMASGLPVVSTRAAGVSELLGDAAAEQVVEFGDVAAFVARVQRFLSQADDAQRVGRLNRQRAASHFDLDQMVRRYEQLYDELL